MPQDNFLNNNQEEQEKTSKEKRFRAKLSEKGFTIDYLRNDFEKSLPYLSMELNSNTENNSKFSLNKYAQDLIESQSDESEENMDEEFEETPEENIIGTNKDNPDIVDGSISSDMEMDGINNNRNGFLKELSQEDYETAKKSIKSKVKSDYNEDSELYLPKTEDFLRRCSDLKEAEEIIAFQLKQRYISEKQAEELIKICREKGLASFGPKKEWGYYERTYRNKSSSL